MTKITVQSTYRNLLHAPLCKEEELGLLVPPSPYALSFALPHWSHVLGYAKRDHGILEQVHQTRTLPYMHPMVQKLFRGTNASFAQMGEEALVFPSREEAERCRAYVESVLVALNKPLFDSLIQNMNSHNTHALTLPATCRQYAWLFYQQQASQVSARMASAILQGHDVIKAQEEGDARRYALRERIARMTQNSPDNIFLHSNFSAALASILRICQLRAPGLKSSLVGFPFWKAYTAQKMTGAGANFHCWLGDEELGNLGKRLQSDRLSCVVCEVPCIPLMNTLNLPALYKLLKHFNIPLIVEDSSATFYNIDPRHFADIVVSSLGGFFSGTGDNAAACVRLMPDSPLYSELKPMFEADYPDMLWCEDAKSLELESQNFEQRMEMCNATAEGLADWLHEHPLISRVYYPKFDSTDLYSRIMRKGRGYGAIIHFTLKRERETTQNFYNKAPITKCLGMGTSFSILSPYALMIHATNLDWAEMHGVSRHLLRLSVGLEPLEELKNRINSALCII